MITSYNNKLQNTFDRMLTFNDKPTIVRIDENATSFTQTPEDFIAKKARLEIKIYAGGIDLSQTYYIRINGHQITSVSNYEDLTSSTFLVINMMGYNFSRSMAYTIADALNSTQLGATYDIWVEGDIANSNGCKLIVQAKQVGAKYNIKSVESNIDNFIIDKQVNGYNGSESTLDNSKIILEIFADNSSTQPSVDAALGLTPETFVAKLEKNATIGGVSFDISPILRSITEDNNTTIYAVRSSMMKNGEHRKITTKTGLIAVNGYPVNQCDDYKILEEGATTLLQYVERGTERAYTNNTLLYCYPEQEIIASFLIPDKENSNFSFEVEYLDSAYNSIYRSDLQQVVVFHGNIYTLRWMLYKEELEGASYVKLTVNNSITLLYNVIQPVEYNEQVQTIYWNNEYGGISFMPFTGKKDEERTSSKKTYKTSKNNYYRTTRKELEKVHTNDYLYEVTIRTHYIAKDGLYLLYSLNNAKTCWTIINGQEYAIIVDSLEFNEVQRNIYEVTVKYHYSADNLI
jgi:hypothetical protein